MVAKLLRLRVRKKKKKSLEEEKEMSVDRRRDLRRTFSVLLLPWALCLLSLCAVRSETRYIRPSDHGLAFQENTTVGSPAMAAFFRGDGSASSAMALPEAKNATDPIWGVAGRVAPDRSGGKMAAAAEGRDRVRAVLLTVGVVCGVVGVALLAAAAAVYVVQARRAEARRMTCPVRVPR